MSAERQQWRVWCTIDNRYELVNISVGEPEPSECPVDPEHPIDASKTEFRARFDANSDLSNTRDVPTGTDDSTKGWAVGSKIQAKDGNVWICMDASEGAAIWKAETGTSQSYSFNPELTMSGVSYVTVASFIWPGSDESGMPSAIKIIGYGTGDDWQAKIVDIGQSKTVCECAVQTNGTKAIVDMGALTSLAALPAIWELQLKRSGSGNPDVFSAAMHIFR